MTRFIPLLFLAVICLIMAASLHKKPAEPSPMVGRPFPALVLGGTAAAPLIGGKVAVVNVFASWCAPCALEHSVLMGLKERAVAPIIGIAWKNAPDDVKSWLAARGNPYEALLIDLEGAATLPLSLTGVPETFVVGRDGLVAYHTKQPVTQKMLREEIIPLVERLSK